MNMLFKQKKLKMKIETKETKSVKRSKKRYKTLRGSKHNLYFKLYLTIESISAVFIWDSKDLIAYM